MRSWTTGLVGMAVAGLLLVAVGACSSTAGNTQGSGNTGATSGPRPAARSTSQMPPLPSDPHAAMVEVRRLLVAQIAPLLADSGQRWTEARYLLTTSDTDETAYQGHLFVTVGANAGDATAGGDPAERLAAAAQARGWESGGISHRLNIVRGPYHLTAAFRPGGGCRYEVTTPALNPRTRIEGTGEVTAGEVPELDGYRASG